MRPLLVMLALLPAAAQATTPLMPAGQVATTQGYVIGKSDDGQVMAWRGIEYARAGRWQLPTEVPRWQGIKQTHEFGPACPQAGQTVMVEDCLFLNVFAPKAAGRGSNLPVVVWFHGGGFRAGSGANAPAAWARDGMIVVSLNYRLGELGFHDWLGWSESDPRNFGQADMVAALKWVNANIDRFGGNPRNVTIYGHSAGGMAVQLMMTDPRAQGLFQRAIADAAYAAWPFPKAANPTPQKRMIMKYGPLETNASVAELVARSNRFRLPYVGGADLAAQPITLLRSGPVRPVPMMTGFTSYDGGGTLGGAGFTPESFLALFDNPASIRTAYASDFAVSELRGAERAFGDRRYGLSAQLSLQAVRARGVPAWGHYVTGPVDAGSAGVRHGGYYATIFSENGLQVSPHAQAFASFIKTGRPSTLSQAWPVYNRRQDNWMVFDPAPKLTRGPIAARLRTLQRNPVKPE